MKRVILNADDFGLSPGVNRGIVQAFREGVLTSTTLLVNLDHWAEAAALAREHPALGVGVHLSLLWGPPVCPPTEVPSLVDDDGCFPRSLTTLARRYFSGRLVVEEVVREFAAQVRRFRETGLEPTHLDTHKHVHCLPGVLEALIEAAAACGITRVRLPVEQPSSLPARRTAGARPGLRARAKRDLIRLLLRRGRQRLASAGLRTTDRFVGIADQAILNSRVLGRILRTVGPGATEIMCHPGYDDPVSTVFSRRPPDRERELRALIDPGLRDVIDTQGIELVSYRDL